MGKGYKRTLRACEASVEVLLRNQNMDAASEKYGGIVSYESGFIDQKSAVGILPILLYFNADSKFYHNEKLFDRIMLMFDFTERYLRPDGTMDLYDCNFFSAPDTAFAIIDYGKTCKIINKLAVTEKEIIIKEKVYQIIKACSYGIVNGGFHTPNHRWVISAALALVCNITGVKAFRDKIDEYLIEGIDCNEDGEYAERSSGIYNIINNNALLIVAEELGMEHLYEPIKRNLNMMLAYFEPDGSLCTSNSTRQDNNVKLYGEKYYPLYLYMAYKYEDKLFEAMANKIIKTNIELGRTAPECLDFYMLYPELKEYSCEEVALPHYINKYFVKSGVVRIVKDGMSITVLKDNPDFFWVQLKEMSLYMRFGISFFNERHLLVKDIKKTEKGYRLFYSGKGGYYLPFKEYQGTSDWWKMSNDKRETTLPLIMNIIVELTELEDGCELNITTSGCDRVPVKVEMGVTPGTYIMGENYTIPSKAGGSAIIGSGYVRVENGKEALIIGPAFADNFFTKRRPGSIEQSNHHFTLYFNDVTNFNRTILIKKS